MSKGNQAVMSEPASFDFARLPVPCPPRAVFFISKAAPFLRCCTIFPFPCLSSSPLFSASSHLNSGTFGIFSPSPLHPGAFLVFDWKLTASAWAVVALLLSADYFLPRPVNAPVWFLSPDLPHGLKITHYLLCLTCSGRQSPTPQ